MKLLVFPDSRQAFEYDCGAAALKSVLEYYGVDAKRAEIVRVAGTSKEHGTSVRGMEKAARHFGLKCKTGKMTIGQLKKSIDRGAPVIVLMQAWPEKEVKDWKGHWEDGHYAVVIGYDAKKIYFEDPYSPSRTSLLYGELLERWHDYGQKKKVRHRNLGIILMGGFEEKVYAACARIKRGKISTYSEIAKAIGNPGAARAVGNALNKNRSKRVPCHRVVCSDGRVGGFAHGSRKKRTMLMMEGVKVVRGKVGDFGERFQRLFKH